MVIISGALAEESEEASLSVEYVLFELLLVEQEAGKARDTMGNLSQNRTRSASAR